MQWVKDNWLLLLGLGVVGLLLGDETIKRLNSQGDQTPGAAVGGGVQASEMPRPSRNASPNEERQVIADNVRVGDRILTDDGLRSVLSVHGDPAYPSMLAFVLDDDKILTCQRADVLVVV